jgi:ATP-dependent NAD(P)H-hydrate dehydratase
MPINFFQHDLQDGLYLITNEPEVISGYGKAILTPNGGEFPRLYKRMVTVHSSP